MPCIIVAVILFLDQASKYFIARGLSFNESYPVIKGIFHLTLVYNKGAAFGMLKNQLPFFIITAFIAIALIIDNLRREKKRNPQSVALSLILGGAIGNLIDRLAFGYVIDFLDFRIWPVFNVADSAITIGAVLLALSIVKKEKKKDIGGSGD